MDERGLGLVNLHTGLLLLALNLVKRQVGLIPLQSDPKRKRGDENHSERMTRVSKLGAETYVPVGSILILTETFSLRRPALASVLENALGLGGCSRRRRRMSWT